MESLKQQFFAWTLVFSFLFAHSKCFAETHLIHEPVSVLYGMKDWISAFAAIHPRPSVFDKTQRGSGYTECREVLELKETYLCVSDTSTEMNLSFGRSTLFVEGNGGASLGEVVSQSDPTLVRLSAMATGFDLRSVDLLAFQSKMNDRCKVDSNFCSDQSEESLFRELVNPLESRKIPFVLIAFSIFPRNNYSEVVTHEILHAQYFLNPAYQEVTHRFWMDDLGEEDRDKIKSLLGKYYSLENVTLIENEFQAYLLMTRAERNLLGHWVLKYRESLIKKLNALGIEPLQVN